MIRTHSQKNSCHSHLFYWIIPFTSRVKASFFLHGGIIPVVPSNDWVQAISIHLIRKKFLSFKSFTVDLQEKSCSSNWYVIFDVVVEEILSPTTLMSQSGHLSIGYCKTLPFFFWLIFFVSSPPSLTTTMRFPHSSSINSSLDGFSKFTMSSISAPSTSSSTITTFSEAMPSWMKPWFFLKRKLEK